MKRLFSPWRSAYIQSFHDGKRKGGCLFCRIGKEKEDDRNLIVWRGKKSFVVMNRYPYNSGHLMIVPYRHTSSFAKLSDMELSEIMRATKQCLSSLEQTSNPQGFNFGSNWGTVAGAGIADHIHFHIVPRWNGDTNFMPVLSDVKLVSEDMTATFEKLKAKFARKKR